MPISKAVASSAGTLLRDATQERRVLSVAGAALANTVRDFAAAPIREKASEHARGLVAGFFGSFARQFGR